MGLLRKILGMEFEGKVVDVQLIRDKTQARGEEMPRFKGYSEEGFAFNRDHYPPIYEVTLEKRGKTREFRICTDNPPEIGSNKIYRVERRGDGTLYY